MLYVIILACLALLGLQAMFQSWERAAWAQERQNLLDRIQAPEAAAVRAAQQAGSPDDAPLTEAQRIRQKAEALGVSVDALRTPPGWGGFSL